MTGPENETRNKKRTEYGGKYNEKQVGNKGSHLRKKQRYRIEKETVDAKWDGKEELRWKDKVGYDTQIDIDQIGRVSKEIDDRFRKIN